jgi:hypothetical protein
MLNINTNFYTNNNFEKICLEELKEKIKYKILDNTEVKKITNNLSTIDILFDTEKSIFCIHINYSDTINNIIEFNNFVTSVKEINKLNKQNKKCYGIFLSKLEPYQSSKAIFNKENINFEKTSNIKFLTIYNNDKSNCSDNYLNLLKRLQSKLHSFGIYYYDKDDCIIMA